MNALDLSTNKKYQIIEFIVKMGTFFRHTIRKLYDAVFAPIAAARGALAERLQNIRETVLYYITE